MPFEWRHMLTGRSGWMRENYSTFQRKWESDKVVSGNAQKWHLIPATCCHSRQDLFFWPPSEETSNKTKALFDTVFGFMGINLQPSECLAWLKCMMLFKRWCSLFMRSPKMSHEKSSIYLMSICSIEMLHICCILKNSIIKNMNPHNFTW